MNRKSFLPVLLLPSVILLIPLSAMLFRLDGWAWGVGDFLVIWVLIAGAVFAYKLVASQAASPAYRIAAGLALTTGLMTERTGRKVKGPASCFPSSQEPCRP